MARRKTMRQKIRWCGERLARCGKLAEIAAAGENTADWETGARYLALVVDELGPTLREVVAFGRRDLRRRAARGQREKPLSPGEAALIGRHFGGRGGMVASLRRARWTHRQITALLAEAGPAEPA